jgi:hypothetical protein
VLALCEAFDDASLEALSAKLERLLSVVRFGANDEPATSGAS